MLARRPVRHVAFQSLVAGLVRLVYLVHGAGRLRAAGDQPRTGARAGRRGDHRGLLLRSARSLGRAAGRPPARPVPPAVCGRRDGVRSRSVRGGEPVLLVDPPHPRSRPSRVSSAAGADGWRAVARRAQRSGGRDASPALCAPDGSRLPHQW